jgi:SH3-like domain-containing protein
MDFIRRIALIATLIACVACFGIAHAAEGMNAKPKSKFVKVYILPEVNAKPAGFAINGTVYPVIAIQGDWVKIHFYGKEGWAKREDLDISGMPQTGGGNEPAPAFSPPSPVSSSPSVAPATVETQSSGWLKVADQFAKVTAGPDPKSKVIAFALKNEEYQLIAAAGEYAKIRYKKENGYILKKSCVSIAAPSAPAASRTAAAPQKSGETGPSMGSADIQRILEKKNPDTTSVLPTGGAVASPSAAPLESPSSGWLKIADQFAKVTTGPDPKSKVIAFALKNEEYQLVSTAGEYAKIRYKDQNGYILKKSYIPIAVSSMQGKSGETIPLMASADIQHILEKKNPDTASALLLPTPVVSQPDSSGKSNPQRKEISGSARFIKRAESWFSRHVGAPPAEQPPAPAEPYIQQPENREGQATPSARWDNSSRNAEQRLPLRLVIFVVIGLMLTLIVAAIIIVPAMIAKRKKLKMRDEKRQEELQQMRAESMSVERYSMQGEIERETLGEMLQYIGAGKKTGSLVIETSGPFGIIYFEKGAIVHATTPNAQDAAAVKQILDLKKGSFRFIASLGSQERTTRIDVIGIMMEWAQYQDEHKGKKT